MDSTEAHSFLNSFANFETQLHKLRCEDFNLSRVEKFLELAGQPERNLRIIHVAGTKGKGSTCAFLASILREAGYKVGLYTSPHLHKVNERIRILSTENIASKDDFSGAIDEDQLAAVLTSLRPMAEAIQNEGYFLTYFEVLTVAALYYFSQARVDMVILETGLGGRLDATNAVESAIAVITPVSLDHTGILGNTLRQIASEKAGIIKNARQQIVIAPQEKEAMDLILQRCGEFGVKPVLVCPQKYDHLEIGLKGKHQKSNAATAVEVANILRTMGFRITDGNVKDGLNHVRWPGRFELLRKEPDCVVDCAHNEASARALSQTMIEEYPHRRIILVLGISQDKDVAAISQHLKDNAAHIILSKAAHPRAHIFMESEGKNYFADKSIEIIENLSKALQRALQIATAQDVILVTGSIFVVAEAIDFFDIDGHNKGV